MNDKIGGWVSSTRLSLLLVIGALLVAGCPDTEGQFNAFLDATDDMRANLDVELGPGGDELAAGTYFMAADTTLLPGSPLYFEVVVTVEPDGDDQIAQLSFQPLKTDIDETGQPRDDARTPTGDPVLVNDVPVVEGRFQADLGEISINGDANPITTGANIVAELSIDGVVQTQDTVCGIVNGDVIQPIQINIDGSTFGWIRDPGDYTEIDEPPLACPEEPDEGDPAADAGTD